MLDEERKRGRWQKVGVDEFKYGHAKSVGGEDQSSCLWAVRS